MGCESWQSVFRAHALDSSTMLAACVLLTSEVLQTRGEALQGLGNTEGTQMQAMCANTYSSARIHAHIITHTSTRSTRRDCLRSLQPYSSTQHSVVTVAAQEVA